jgi:hypothetical protein
MAEYFSSEAFITMFWRVYLVTQSKFRALQTSPISTTTLITIYRRCKQINVRSVGATITRL